MESKLDKNKKKLYTSGIVLSFFIEVTSGVIFGYLIGILFGSKKNIAMPFCLIIGTSTGLYMGLKRIYLKTKK